MSYQDAPAGLVINTRHIPSALRSTSSNPLPAQTPPRAPPKYGPTPSTPSSISRGTNSRASDSSHSHAHTLSQSTNSHSHHVKPFNSSAIENGINFNQPEGDEEEPVKFVLLAEFDIDAGATLAQQYPFPTGTDEHTLAELMLPDGAHLRPEDWTIFYLNQTRANAVAPVLAHESPGRHLSPTSVSSMSYLDMLDANAKAGSVEIAVEGSAQTKTSAAQKSGVGEMLFVLNCVRMKEDKTARRGALVKALAICTSNPYIQIYKPLLLLALDEYFTSPNPAVLSRLFDSLNAIPMKGCPTLSRNEKLILRASESKVLFEDRFADLTDLKGMTAIGNAFNVGEGDVEDLGEVMESTSIDRHSAEPGEGRSMSAGGGVYIIPSAAASASRFEWDQQTEDSSHTSRSKGSIASRLRKSSRVSLRESDSSRNSSPAAQVFQQSQSTPPRELQQNALGIGRPRAPSARGGLEQPPGSMPQLHAMNKRDTHFFDTSARFKGLNIPIRIPLSTFEEEVGDYSVINLFKTFNPPNLTPFAGPYHPHLHTSGPSTHPIILLMNALLTQKRIIFLGHGQPAGKVANLVLATCALTGQVLRGFTERAFPYSNLAGLDMLEEMPGFIAGVTNPRFEQLPTRWDVLCNMETGKIIVSKEIGKAEMLSMHSDNQSMSSLAHSVASKTEEDVMPAVSAVNSMKDGRLDVKGETTDTLFIEDITSSIASHIGETVVRAKFADYFGRFVRLAARYEQDVSGTTKIGFPSRAASHGRLGSGMVFPDDAAKTKEMNLNLPRIEGWRKSKSYLYWRADFQADLANRTIKGFDLHYQLSRLRNAKNMSEAEAELIYCSLGNAVNTYEQVIELLAQLPMHLGGLMPIALGLFHRSDAVKNAVIDLLDSLQSTMIGRQLISTLNMFLHSTWQRLSEERQQYR